MTNKIPFPKNYERFIELAQEELQKNQLAKAVEFFEQAYEIQQNFSLNHLLVSTYLEIDENEQALALASEMKENYFASLDYLELYIQLLIKNHRFIQAHSIINDRILLERSGELRKLISLKKKIRHIELRYRQFEVRKIAELEEELSHLCEHNYYEQLAIVKKAGQLPQAEFMSISKKILLDSQVHNLVRSWILEEMANLHVKVEIEFLWKDNQIHTIVPAVVGTPVDSAAYQRMLLFLEKELINDDPILLVEIIEEIRLHSAVLYPLADEIIDDPKLWAISYISTYNESIAKKYQLEENEPELMKIRKIQNNIRSEFEMMFI